MGAGITDQGSAGGSWSSSSLVTPTVTQVAEGARVTESVRSIPTTGMRGGLGRTLLTAFLILTILPLTLSGGYAIQQNRRNLEKETEAKLQAVADLKSDVLEGWFDKTFTILKLSVALDRESPDVTREVWWSTLRNQLSDDLVGVTVLNATLIPIWSVGNCSEVIPSSRVSISHPDGLVTLFVPYQDEGFLFCFQVHTIERVIRSNGMSFSDGGPFSSNALGETGKVYLVHDGCVWSGGKACTPLVETEAADYLHQGGLYTNHNGTAVIGSYAPLPNLGLGVLVEQAQAEILESTDRIAAAFIAMVLAVALATTAIAAIVIRQITRPVIGLTESALAMAAGELDQHISVHSRDEIGILTFVFNEMAAELKSLYDDLEAKVVQRTQMLQKANYQIQRRVLYLEASQAVGQVITSIRDPNVLLTRVSDLIRERFVYASVAIYLVQPGGGRSVLHAMSPRDASWPTFVHAGDGSIVTRAIRTRQSVVHSQETGEEVEWFRRTLARIVVPLVMEDRVLGTISVLSTDREHILPDELKVLEILANQVAIALENARAYERERLAAKQLEQAEVFKAQFLANMSHELREPLNTIIGFSRLMLKGLDGPLNPQQQQDLKQVYNDSQKLLLLINDILVSSQIQAGLMELRLQPMDLVALVNAVMPTASALVRGKDIELTQDISPDLPQVCVDPTRIRQVLVHLLTNAAKFTQQGKITIRGWASEGLVYISISDTGLGIPADDLDRIFVRFEKGSAVVSRRYQGIGLGLALCKEFVELHGGQIWVVSEVGKGSTFTFSLPVGGSCV